MAEQRIRLRNEVSEVGRFDRLVDEVARDESLGVEQVFATRLCAHEAITNIIAYAFPDGDDHWIDVGVTVTPTEIQLEIVDDGRPFDPMAVAPPPAFGDIDELT